MTASEQDKAELSHEAGKNTLASLLNPFTRSDHKILGFSYLALVFTQLYLVTTRDTLQYLDEHPWFHIAPSLCAMGVCISALRNFRFLPRKRENPGMFANNRTFSYAFLVENLWFQVLILLYSISQCSYYRLYLEPPVQTFLMLYLFATRELVPKTSYVSWKQGNEKVNHQLSGMDRFWVSVINMNVKLVRWNYVLKKTLGFYLFFTVQAEWFHGVPEGTYNNTGFLLAFTYISMDAQWNVTAAFFLQTLKFKGFISAELFSFLFNITPVLGFIVTMRYLFTEPLVWSVMISAIIDTFFNLYVFYPAKRSAEWKNRAQVIVKTLVVAVAMAWH